MVFFFFTNARVKERSGCNGGSSSDDKIEEGGGGVIDAQPRTGNSGQERIKNTQGIKLKRKKKEIIHNTQSETGEGKKKDERKKKGRDNGRNEGRRRREKGKKMKRKKEARTEPMRRTIGAATSEGKKRRR